MRRKIIAVIIVMLMSISGITFVNDNIIVKADTGYGEDIKLDSNFIYNMTYNLSRVVYDYPKGREFGTKGEQFTKDNIILPEMLDIFGAGNVTIESIENVEPESNENNLTHYLETLSQGITIHHNEEDIPINEFYITPRWNDSQNKSLLNFNFSYQELKIIRDLYDSN